jgi:mannose-6-phosphate isomerase-like protein (cupin superfamily)
MSMIGGAPLALSRMADDEVIGHPASATRLLLDGSMTGGAMAVLHSQLGEGVAGPGPHEHKRFSELLYVCSGALQVLAGEQLTVLEQGDSVVVPPRLVHAFAAAPGQQADVLIVGAPGLDRFDYFRELSGATVFPPPVEFQERFDNWFLQSEVWAQRSVWDRDTDKAGGS